MKLTERTMQSSRRAGAVLPAVVACVLATATLFALGTAVLDTGRMRASGPEIAPTPALSRAQLPLPPSAATQAVSRRGASAWHGAS